MRLSQWNERRSPGIESAYRRHAAEIVPKGEPAEAEIDAPRFRAPAEEEPDSAAVNHRLSICKPGEFRCRRPRAR
jgi:hypothetical protein